MKIFVGGLYQETNSFCPKPTEVSLFEREKLAEGPAIWDGIEGSNLELAGMLDELGRRYPEARLIPGVYARGIASGPMTNTAATELSRRFLASLKSALPVDAVVVTMHGSMGSELSDDCEGDLLEQMRLLLGPKVPVAVSFDSHAAITGKILRAVDVLAGYRTYPHTDQAETGQRTVVALAGMLDRGGPWQPVVRRWPAVIPVDNAQTDSGPMRDFLAAVTALDRDPDVLTTSVFSTHPWFDTPEHGPTALAYVRPAAVRRIGRTLETALRELWRRRHEFLVVCPDAAEFFRTLENRKQPVAAIDTGDITTAGAPGDSTVILRAAQAGETPRMLLPIVDPETVAQAHAGGVNTVREFRLGGSEQPGAYNTRTPMRAEVLRLGTGPVRLTGAAFRGVALDYGPRALLRAGPITVLATHYSSWFHDPEFWRSMSVEPATAGIIVQKSHKLFRPAYAGMTRETISLETAGCTDRRLARLPYRRLVRPIFPLDDVSSFECIRSL